MLNLQRPEERRELAQFVRELRTRTKPQDVGLPAGARRRTPGLRREEVAQLAGVSVTWYTWFEQGRDIQVSASFLDKISVALCLSVAERAQLFDLAQRRALVPVAPSRPVASSSSIALARRDVPAAVYVDRPTLAPIRVATDAESHRINEAIRKVIVAEEGRAGPVPPALAVSVARGWRSILQLCGTLALAMIFMLVPY